MPLEHPRRDSLDGSAVGDVALLVLVRFRGAPREATTAMPRACSARTSSAPMPERRPRDEGYLQISEGAAGDRRVARGVASVASRWCVPFFNAAVFHATE